MTASRPSAATGDVEWLLIPLAIDLGFETYDVVATSRLEKSAIVYGIQTAVALPQVYITHEQLGFDPEVELGSVLMASWVNHLLLMGGAGLFVERPDLPAAYGVSWGLATNLAFTDAALAAVWSGRGWEPTAAWGAIAGGTLQAGAVGAFWGAGQLSAENLSVFVPAVASALWGLGVGAYAAVQLGEERRPLGVVAPPPWTANFWPSGVPARGLRRGRGWMLNARLCF